MQDRLQKGLPSVAITGLPIAIPLHTALRRFANPFRVASFGRADLTKFPWISPVTCEGDTALVLASCKGFTFYQILPLVQCIAQLTPMQAILCDSWHLPF